MTTPYPFDLSAPGAVDRLLAFHRSLVGEARMEADDAQDDSGDDKGDGEARTDSPKPAPPPQDEQERRDADQLGDAGRKAIAEERKAKAAEKRRADEAERQLEEMRRQQMTEQERVAAERDDWRKKYEEQAAALAARELDLLRRDVAAEKGLPAALARRLDGTTREELDKDAEALKALIPDPDAPRAPRPDPSAGSIGDKGKPTSVTDAMDAYKARQHRSKSQL